MGAVHLHVDPNPKTEDAAVPLIPGLRIPPQERRARVHTERIALSGTAPAPAIWILGAHGGAGATTLARQWAPAADAAGGWPAAEEFPYVVVVARTHRTGLTAAHDKLLQAAGDLAGHCTVLGLVLIPSEPGKLPKTLQRLQETITDVGDGIPQVCPRVWHLPWIPDLRIHPTGDLAVWSPLHDAEMSKSRRRSIDSTQHPHPAVAAAGREVFAAARVAANR